MERKYISLPDVESFINKTYEVVMPEGEFIDSDEDDCFLHGKMQFKVTGINRDYVKFKVVSPIDVCMPGLTKWAKRIADDAKENMKHLQEAIDLWEKSPEQFVRSEDCYYPVGHESEEFLRKDGKKPKYSYQAMLLKFNNLQWYKTVYAENAAEFKRFDEFGKGAQKYLYGILKDKKEVTTTQMSKLKLLLVK